MNRRRVLTIVIVLLLCASLLGFGLFATLRGQDSSAPSPEPVPIDLQPKQVEVSTPDAKNTVGRLPGELARPLTDLTLFEDPEYSSEDRQLDLGEGEGKSVEFEAPLGDLGAYAAQEIQWKDCGGRLCATVLAPLDWDNPAEAAVRLNVMRRPAREPKHDPIFINPGGPGAPGTEFLFAFGPTKLPNHDIIGWDPRGTGQSTHVVCGSTEQTDAIKDLDGTPDDDTELEALRQGARDFAAQCREHSGKLLDHVTSVDVVRDMDLLRHLMGAKKFNFLGVSYGTYIGAMYATLFPDTAGRLVLDAAVEITNAEPVLQVEGFELAFRNWSEWCAKEEGCQLGDGTAESVQREISDWLETLDQHPVNVGERKLTQTHAAIGIAFFLYADAGMYSVLAQMISDAMAGEGSGLLDAADQLNGRSGRGWDTLAFAFPAMRCVDGPDRGADYVGDYRSEAEAKAPMLGKHMGIEYTCEYWGARPLPTYKLDAKGAAPILVVGSTGDSATPYQQAVRMAGQLEGAKLLTYDGPGHGITTSGNSCVDEVVNAYFASGALPEDGKTCS